MSYAESAPVTINLTIAFDNANQIPYGVGVATGVGRTLGDIVTGPGA